MDDNANTRANLTLARFFINLEAIESAALEIARLGRFLDCGDDELIDALMRVAELSARHLNTHTLYARER